MKNGIVLELNQKARIDFTLQVGAVTDTIAVTATAPVLKTDDATIGEVVDRQLITQLPLNGRNSLNWPLSPRLACGWVIKLLVAASAFTPAASAKTRINLLWTGR